MKPITSFVAALVFSVAAATAAQAAGEPPLVLAKEGYFYVGGHPVTVDGQHFLQGQMYVEYRVPAKRTHPYPVIMVHGGTMSGINYTGTPDGREGWAQYFVRRGYAVYVVDQPGRARSSYNEKVYGTYSMPETEGALKRFTEQEKYRLWPQAHLHTQWPGSGGADDPAVQELQMSQLPAIADFTKQQSLNRDALVALLDRIGPSILLVHSQAGAFGWPVADARPDKVKAIPAIEPNGPPFYDVQFTGAPDYFKQGKLALTYGITAVPLTYDPPVKDPSELAPVQEAQADAPEKVRCWLQPTPARQLPNLAKMPILVLTAEASYHAPYDHCTVKYLQQAGVKPSVIRLADVGIHGNSHVMMLEKNNQQIAGVIVGWLDRALPKNGKKVAAR